MRGSIMIVLDVNFGFRSVDLGMRSKSEERDTKITRITKDTKKIVSSL